jgi:hypothetical protein
MASRNRQKRRKPPPSKLFGRAEKNLLCAAGCESICVNHRSLKPWKSLVVLFCGRKKCKPMRCPTPTEFKWQNSRQLWSKFLSNPAEKMGEFLSRISRVNQALKYYFIKANIFLFVPQISMVLTDCCSEWEGRDLGTTSLAILRSHVRQSLPRRTVQKVTYKGRIWSEKFPNCISETINVCKEMPVIPGKQGGGPDKNNWKKWRAE